uniref:beta-L-arabinofuranosidase domain-containing protein n=1 Tax=uncultured Maricaulis sp. TaxID=174710 RepID=UPI0030DD5DA9
MKSLGLALGLIVVLLVAAIFILPAVIPASTYREPVETAARDALNREVSLDGDIALQIFPQLQIRASNVSIANAEGFGEDAFANMQEMRVGVRLIPLLSRRVEITEFVLIEPTIRLAQNRRGNNWTFTAPDAAAAAPATEGAGFVRREGALPIEASFGDVRIENGALYFTDGSQSRAITGLDLSVALPSLDAETRVTGALNADGQSLSFSANIGSIRDFFEGRETPVMVGLGGNLADLSFTGRILAGEAIAYDGELDATIPSVRALAAFAGAPLPAGENLERFRAVGQLSGAPGEISLNARTLALDDIAGSGSLAVNLSGQRPLVSGGLVLTELDVNPYLPVADDTAAPASPGGIPPWSEAPIDLAGLGVVDADLSLSVDRLLVQAMEIGNARLRVNLRNSRLEDPELEQKADQWIVKIAAAQEPDGYINTYYTLTGIENRWTDMEKHEAYCAGHLLEAGVAYFQATGKRPLLDVGMRMADHMDREFRQANKPWVTGHEELELALVKLFKVTGENRYLELADWFLDQRGRGYGKGAIWDNPDWGPAYAQDAVPVKE